MNVIVLYSHIHIHNTNISGNIVNNNDDFSERTNTLLYKNIISHTLFSKAWFWLCERDELETGTDCYFDPKFLFDHSSPFSSSWLGCLTMGHWEPKALCLPLVLNSVSCLQLTCFSKYPNSQSIASGQDVIHTPVPFTIWGLLWQLWLSYPLCVSVNCTQCLRTWTKYRIIQSSTKLNDKI